MRIEKTILIEFDEVAERQRLESVFKKRACRDTLIQILDHFVAAEWAQAIQLVKTLNRDELEFLHPDVFDVLKAINATANEKASKIKTVEILNSVLGESRSTASFDYPKFTKVD